jgi:hypothetical protein
MSSSQELYNRLNKKLRELVHVKNGKQVTNWIWLIVGILQSQSSNLSQIANYLPLETKAESRVTKIRRWLMNPQVKVWQFYKAILEHVLSGWLEVEAFIILDGVMVFGDRWQIFRVSLQHGSRAIPLAWTVVEGKGLVKVARLKSMLEKVQKFLKKHVKRVTLLADAGLRLGATMRKTRLELCDSDRLQHLHHHVGRNVRPLGQPSSRELQSLFSRGSAYA